MYYLIFIIAICLLEQDPRAFRLDAGLFVWSMKRKHHPSLPAVLILPARPPRRRVVCDMPPGLHLECAWTPLRPRGRQRQNSQ